MNEAKNVDSTVVLARLFNEVHRQKIAKVIVQIIVSDYLGTPYK
jgi:hypothetical protein